MKVGHFNTAFRASLLFFVSLCSSVALSDGTCYLTQYVNGEYVIRCEGDGIWINYIDHTNEVYIIENCETLKANLLSVVDSVSSGISYALTTYDLDYQIQFLKTYGRDMEDDTNFQNDLETLSRDYGELKSYLNSCANELNGDLSSADPPRLTLAQQIENIQCGSCSTNSSGGGSCCDVDLTPILRQLNNANNALSSITNVLGSDSFAANLTYYRRFVLSSSGVPSLTSIYPYRYGGKRTIYSILNEMQQAVGSALSSINNYLYKVSFEQLPNISNNLEIVMSTSTNLYIASTNHFSFFRNMTLQDSPLIDYSQQSTFDSYYDFLTNHYVKVSFKQYDSLVGDEKAKTNWFSRIETLLAALVFNDSEGTNTVDDTYGQSQQDNLINSLEGMNQTSTTQVNLMSNMGDSLLASLRSLNSSFSSAVSMPGEVKLATIGQDNSMQSNIIKFQSSEISQLVEACRCATTLAWCFGGIWLLFLFVSWSVKTSYSLCVFCWSVVSAIFGGGKT